MSTYGPIVSKRVVNGVEFAIRYNHDDGDLLPYIVTVDDGCGDYLEVEGTETMPEANSLVDEFIKTYANEDEVE